MDILELADRLWNGSARIEEHYPFAGTGELAEVAPGVAFVWSFANIVALHGSGEVTLVDTGPPVVHAAMHERVSAWRKDAVRTAIYSHGHIDHVTGARALPRTTRVVAHEAVNARFDRYIMTAGYNTHINRRQFGAPGLEWPTEYRRPDITYTDHLSLDDLGVELHHARGETDDHTWTWIAEHKIVCSGDLFIWASPNAGNPQKVQRYPLEWSRALRTMVSLQPEVLLPGHGVPVIGADRVAQALNDTAASLEHLVERTLALMNDGARLDDVLHGVTLPTELLARPYLQPIYDDPEFIVRNIWRLYGGWWDGNPATLKPAREADVAREIAELAGGADRLAARAEELAEEGHLRLATHLIELAGLASADVSPARARILELRARTETSLMARNIFRTAAQEAPVSLGDPEEA